MECDKIILVMAYEKLILGKVGDNEMPLLNIDLQLSSVGRLPTDEPVKIKRSVTYLQLGLMSMDFSMKSPTDEPVKSKRSVTYLQLGLMSMNFSTKIKTQVVGKFFRSETDMSTFGKTIKHLKEAFRSFKDQSSQFVTQSANPNFISLARKFGSTSDCMEWLFIPLNLVVIVLNVY